MITVKFARNPLGIDRYPTVDCLGWNFLAQRGQPSRVEDCAQVPTRER
jgi:hypothetical protein